MNSQQAINLLNGLEQRLDDYYGLNNEGKAAFRMAITALELFGNAEQLPSAQPEQRWIPCGERMPEEREWIGTKQFGTTISDEVYVTFEAPDGQRFADHISFQNGKLSRSDEHRMKVLYKGAKPIAWMPLPEPYGGDENE